MFNLDDQVRGEQQPSNKAPLLETATALTVSFVICKTATYLSQLFGCEGGSLQFITAIVVALATVFPTQFGYIAPAGESIALILMQVGSFSPTKMLITLLYLCNVFLNN